MLDILQNTFPSGLEDDDDVKDYLKKFLPLKQKIIISENSKDWLVASVDDNVTGACGIK